MKITWVTRSFLDYRIPLYAVLNELSGNQLTVIYNAEVVPMHCQDKLKAVIESRSIGLTDEFRLGGKKVDNASFANSGFRIPLQKGLLKIIKSTEPNIILSDGFFQWTYSAYWFKIFHNTPHIMLYERTTHTERHTPLWRAMLRKLMLPFIDRIGCNGIETHIYLKEILKVKDEKLFIGNMSADNSGLAARVNTVKKELKQNKNKLIFLYVGQLIERKGLLQLLKTWVQFEKNCDDVMLLIIGSGAQEQELKRYCNMASVKTVEFLGKVDYDEVVNYYAQADIFIIPTLEDNWSLVVPEAMSCGLPIISSKYNGCWPELVRKENGWVFDPLDKTNFLNTLADAYAHSDDWTAMGEVSTEIVNDFTPERIANTIYISIKNILIKPK